MFDKRLIRELKRIKGYFILQPAAALAAALLAILQAVLLASLVSAVLVHGKRLTQLEQGIILLVLVIAIKALLGMLSDYFNRSCAIQIKQQLKKELLQAITKQGPVKLRSEKEGTIVSMVEDGVEAFDAFYAEFVPQLMTVAIALPCVLLAAFVTDVTSGLIMLVTAPLIPVFMILIGKMADYFNKRQWKSLIRMSSHFLDVLKGLPTLKLFGRSKAQGRIMEQVSDSFRDSTIGVLKISFLSALVLELVATISTAILSVALGIRLIYGTIGFESAFLILLLAPEYYLPLRQLGAKFHSAMNATAAADSVYAWLPSNQDKAKAVQSTSGQQMNREADSQKDDDSASIAIHNLRYSYEEGLDALDGVTFSVQAGEKVALVGPSGGGKSTMLSILAGFLPDYQGSVELNGQELSRLGTDYRSRLAYVQQQPKVFKDTIYQNMIMANPEASLEQVMEAAKVAGLHEFVSGLPERYDTIVGDGGIKLSGGQIQLLSIARACLKNATLVLMDEPTSGLDVESEKTVLESLRRAFVGKTVITIAHRLSTITSSDKILVLESGCITEAGTHEQLLERNGSYARMLSTAQLVAEEGKA